MNGIADPEEDINGDGKHNIIDCLPENLQQQVAERLKRTIDRVSVTSEVNTDPVKMVEAVCPNGYVAIGGGHEIDSPMSNWMINVSKSYPASVTIWRVQAEAPVIVKDAWSVTAWAICDKVTQ
jgi:hypothetical protein